MIFFRFFVDCKCGYKPDDPMASGSYFYTSSKASLLNGTAWMAPACSAQEIEL